ncbi:MAG: methionyl-tRNA formyltransferase [Lachnospiraceae bacterium]|nr:methionyl-tRNA formyltransferase [Lachnospiraceae bacterium]
MRVIFMGTPDFAVASLEEIIKAGHEVVLVVTQPDKPRGRGKSLAFPPVKECALSHDIEVFQPGRIRDDANVEYLKKYQPDIIIVAAFGQILPKSILDLPKYGCVNVHASLLPKYRGAAPIQWAVINGDEITGVTTMRMDVGLDTGDMIAKRQVRIEKDETGGSLFDKLADTGAKLCVETMDMLEKGTATFTPQNNEESTHTRMITKELGNIDWTKSAVEIERLIRGLNPWPSAYTHLDNKTFKIWKAEISEETGGYEPGCIVRAEKDQLLIQTGDGTLALKEVQLEGKKRMDTGSFLRGYTVEPGTFLIE